MKLRYTVQGAADALDVSKTQVERIIESGDLVVHQDTPGGTRYVSDESLRQYIRWREEQGCTPRGKTA